MISTEPSSTDSKPVKVLIVDDSPIVRKVLARQLAQDHHIQIVGAAPDPYKAREMIVQYRPDVLTLDIEMPRMDGLTFLRKLMQHYPLPVIILSSLTAQGSSKAIEALNAGAFDVISKPSSSEDLLSMTRELISKIKTARQARLISLAGTTSQRRIVKPSLGTVPAKTIIAIGASTGGVSALTQILGELPTNSPPVLITQHMPAHFTESFANRLNSISQLTVQEARHGDLLQAGCAYVAPGGLHLTLVHVAEGHRICLKDGPMVNHHKPSVDVMFHSIAQQAGRTTVGVLLTGMGCDGANGLFELRQQGAMTVAQDELSCVVYGMPKEAVKLGAAQRIVSLPHIAQTICNLITHPH